MSKTNEYLQEAFAGESQANRKYLAFAKKADQEGHAQAARLFRAAAMAETVHAHNHLRAMGGIKTTEENLKEAIGGETHEFMDMYPEMIRAAEAEEKRDARRTFHYANEVEKVHAELYKMALDSLGSATETGYYVCMVCGNTVEGEPPEVCPICEAKKKAFEKVE